MNSRKLNHLNYGKTQNFTKIKLFELLNLLITILENMYTFKTLLQNKHCEIIIKNTMQIKENLNAANPAKLVRIIQKTQRLVLQTPQSSSSSSYLSSSVPQYIPKETLVAFIDICISFVYKMYSSSDASSIYHTFRNTLRLMETVEDIECFQNSIQPEDITMGNLIGCGGFAKVFAGKYKEHAVAIKKYNKKSEWGFETEIATLFKVQHPNIVKIFGYVYNARERFIVLELILGDRLSTKRECGLWMKVCLFNQITNALVYLESLNYYHTDLTENNIMVDANDVVKIIDFNLVHNDYPCSTVEDLEMLIFNYFPEDFTVTYRISEKCSFGEMHDVFNKLTKCSIM